MLPTGSRRAASGGARRFGAGVVLPGAPASAGADPEALLRDARDASEDAALAGVVEVRWREGDVLRSAETDARSREGAVIVGHGNNLAVGGENSRWSANDGIATRWGGIDDEDPPKPGSTWNLEVDDPVRVAGRDAYVVVARDDDDTVRARFYVDQDLGILLRRDVLQEDGDIDRSVRYTRLSAADVVPPVPPVPVFAPGPSPTDDVGEQFVAPRRLEPGFHLLGRYQHPDGTVQLFYNDGLFSLSVFEQQGAVDWGALPDGGHSGVVDGERASTYSTAAGTVVVWGRDDLVLTGVSDAPPDIAFGAFETLDGTDDDLFTELVDFVLGPFGWN
jgi:sigma-E factor negative regulatory protein RseB